MEENTLSIIITIALDNNATDTTVLMEYDFHCLAISRTDLYNMAKRSSWEPYGIHPRSESPGESSSYSRGSRYVARDDYGHPSRDPLPAGPDPHAARAASPFGGESMDYNYDDECYLTSLLSDYGLQLSPGGTSIEHDPTQYPFAEVKPESEPDRSVGSASPPPSEALTEEGVKATTLPHSKFRKITQFSRASHDKEETDPISPSRLPIPSLEPLPDHQQQQHAQLKKKAKKYECEQQMDDPEEERKRLNAINARRNRVKQKEITQQLREKARNLQDVNQKCGLIMKRMDGDARKLKQQLEEVHKGNAVLEKTLKDRDSEIREQREKLVLFRGHLDLIASSLDEDNPAQRLILNLLKKLPASQIHSDPE